MVCLKEKYAKKSKNKKESKCFIYMIASVYSKRCGSYRIYLKGDSPHQAVMIVCELKIFSYLKSS